LFSCPIAVLTGAISGGAAAGNAKLTDDEERAKDARFGTCG
jgi:hypothetical protein